MVRSTLLRPVNRSVSRLVARLSETVLPAAFVTRMREVREWKTWVDKLEANALSDLTSAPDDVKRALFKKFVSLVEIEVHAGRVTGQLLPPQPGSVRLLTSQGAFAQTTAGPTGCFVLDRPASGPLRLECDIGGPILVTEWVPF